ncbi:FAD/NAD(P)-binding domain-containing protein [Melanomma pulvis-pyrius CBS 109.77]|uniref:FAD/NAD(P)-binding domain-containing protein n=1 Tax=Melanomma pulvis-pyrius CBS 109.77 TaxID=1314802 RepID=A0A6A6XWH3_9PLEO|nr:FAD/NAD(P)-binding domain-containing protein [Melanomma pulvis-pyrius CBS 109.77]
MSRQPLNIVVLGGSYAGLSVAHHFLDNIIHQLSSFKGAPTYRVVLISPSTHLYWNICAPRALVSPNLVDLEDAFVPIEPAFSRHPFNEFEFIQGWAIEVDTSARKVKIELVKNQSTKRISGISKASSIQTIPFHAIIVATGTSAHSPLYTLHGTHEETLAEIQAFHRKLDSAHSVVIVGGGPSGVETAGQIATYYNLTPPDSTAPRMSKTITLLSGGPRLLPKLPRTVSKKAEKRLRELGVHVVHKLRELGHTTNQGGSSTDCHLNNDMTITSDLLISATGVNPNTRFFSNTLLDESRYVITDRETLRIYGQGIGGRLYAIGDCASYSRNYLPDVYDAIPVLMKNLHNDLLAHEYRLQTITAAPDIAALEDAKFAPSQRDTQLLPITRFGGAGTVRGWRVPGFVVWMLKGWDYGVGRAKEVVEGRAGRR